MKPKKSSYIQLDSAKIHFEIYGSEGETLLLLHGNGENGADCYARQLEPLSKDHTVIVMDSRGQGKSTFGIKKLTIKQIAADAFALLEALGVDKVSVIGFSDGANVAMEMLLSEKSGIIEKAVLAGGNLDPSGVKEIYQKPIELSFKLLASKARKSSAARRKLSVMALMVREPNISPDALGKISAPVLVMAGSRDMIKEAHTELIASSIPNAKLKIIPGCGHFVFSKAAGAANTAVLEFLHE
ncbi:MAG: alpha/beta hydrolase [Oscillospiraceae bacterium]|nr:alpha/beta hydrolase [Oscillospiraceae bacterium]